MDISSIRRKEEIEQELRRILPIIISQYHPCKIILFGSLAHNQIKETSDIDLFIIKDTQERYWKRIDEVIHLIHPREDLDIFVLTPQEIKDNLEGKNPYLKEILEEGKVIYERRDYQMA